MGNFLSTNSSGVEEVASQASGAYKYPPSGGGSFFANHFIMGGEKFDSPQPEAFLFGENVDLNFLGGKPGMSCLKAVFLHTSCHNLMISKL